MDIQDKLVIRISNPYQREVVVDLAKIADTKEMFCAVESDTIEMKLVSDQYSVRVEDHDSDELIQLVNGEFIEISEGSTDLNNSYISGYYHIETELQDSKINTYFTINPIPGLTSSSLMMLKEALDKFQGGLWIDFFSEKSKEYINGESLSSKNYFTEMMYFINRYNSLMSSIRRISKNPIENVILNYKVESFPKKQDMRTQRWQQRQESKGANNLYLNRKTELNINSRENVFLKFLLKNIIYHIALLENDLKYNLEKKHNHILTLEEDKNNKENDLKEIDMNKKVTKNSKMTLSSGISHLDKEIKQSKDQVRSNLLYLKNLNKMRYELEELIYFGWMSKIDFTDYPKLTMSFLANTNYKVLYDFYLTFVKKMKVGFEDKESNNVYMSKRTNKLFELYHLVLVFYALKNKGYDFCNTKDSFQSLFSNLESSNFSFMNKEFKVDVRYDLMCQQELAGDKGFIAQGQHNKPDIIVLIKNHNDEALYYLIFEIKCRRLNNIYVRKGNTSVMETATDYANGIKYVEENKIKDIKKSVFVVYPDNVDKIIEDKYTTYTLVSSDVTINYEENHLYKKLKTIFADY